MSWHLVLLLFSLFCLMLALLFRGDQARVVVALHQQVLVLQRQLGKQPSLVKGEQSALVLSGLLLARNRTREAPPIVKPGTLVGRHRATLRRHERFLSPRTPGRPPEPAPETSSLSRRSGDSSTTTVVSPPEGALGSRQDLGLFRARCG